MVHSSTFRWFAQGGQFKNRSVRIDDKVVLVTGCNTGIGKETVLELARRGARVYMACRDVTRCEEARKDIVEQTGNKKIFNRTLDLASLDSIRTFAKTYVQINGDNSCKSFNCHFFPQIPRRRISFGHPNQQCRRHGHATLRDQRWL